MPDTTSTMRLRPVLMLMSLLLCLSVSGGGFLYYTSLRDAAMKQSEREAETRAVLIQKNLAFMLSESIKPVKTLAGTNEIRQALADPTFTAVNRANAVLDLFQQTLRTDACYLINVHGITIASSNRNLPDSFVGEDFSFRPYFRRAIRGEPFNYLALGKSSHKRGAYYSCPVMPENGEKPVGVAVIKMSIERIENSLHLGEHETVLMASPDGIIFIATRPQWLYHSLTPLSPEQSRRTVRAIQFGPGPWPSIGLKSDGNRATDNGGSRYLLFQAEMPHFPGWRLMHLKNTDAAYRRLSGPIIRLTGGIILFLCLLVGAAVFFVYRKGSREILRRQNAERALRRAKEDLSRYSKELEIQVQKRTQEITNILKYTPDLIYIKDLEGRYLLINRCYEKIFGVKNEEIRGRVAHEFVPSGFADEFLESDQQVVAGNKPIQVESRIPLDDGVHTYLSVKFPVYDADGHLSGVGGISTDITELKKAQRQLQRLSASVIHSQEKERAAISRELHDELGQILTALRIDTVWLMKRLEKSDEKGAERAGAIRDLIDQTIEDVRGIALRLRPGVLDDLGLVDALEWFANDFEKRSGITCIFEYGTIPAVSDVIATVTYRIAQEALTNTARHADASRVEMTLTSEDGLLVLTVSDDGCGFDPSAVSENDETEGLGLAGMKERAALVGGELEVLSLPGEGARVHFSVKMTEVSEEKNFD